MLTLDGYPKRIRLIKVFALTTLVILLLCPNTGIAAYHNISVGEVHRGLDTIIRRELDRKGRHSLLYGKEKQYVTVEMRVRIDVLSYRSSAMYNAFYFMFPDEPPICLYCDYLYAGFGSVEYAEIVTLTDAKQVESNDFWYPAVARFTYLFDPECVERYENQFFARWEVERPRMLRELRNVITTEHMKNGSENVSEEPVKVYFCDYNEHDVHYYWGFQAMAICVSGDDTVMCTIMCNDTIDSDLDVLYDYSPYPKDVYLDFCMNNVFDEEILYFDE